MSKCAVLSVTIKRKPSTYDYYMDDQQIPRTANQDYLGITSNTKLSWQPHINKVQNRARKTLGLIKRTLHVAPPKVRTTTHEVLVLNQCLSMLLAPGHPTPRHTFRKLNECSVPQLILSLVTIGKLKVSLPCVLTSCGMHCILVIASEMPLCFMRFTMDKFASVAYHHCHSRWSH